MSDEDYDDDNDLRDPTETYSSYRIGGEETVGNIPVRKHLEARKHHHVKKKVKETGNRHTSASTMQFLGLDNRKKSSGRKREPVDEEDDPFEPLSGGKKGKKKKEPEKRKYWYKRDDLKDEDDGMPDASGFYTRNQVPDETDDGVGFQPVRHLEEIRELSDDSTVSSIDSLPEITEADISHRGDRFIDFLSITCGHSALAVADCFTSRPPMTCSTYSAYRLYMTAAPRTMLNATDDIIQRASHRKLTLEHCIGLPDEHPLRNSVAYLAGVKFRKIFLDNPIRSVTTKVTTMSHYVDFNRALRRMIHDIGVYLSSSGNSYTIKDKCHHTSWGQQRG